MIKLAETEEEIEKALDIRYEVEQKPQGRSKDSVKKSDINDKPITLIYMDGEEIVGTTTAFIIENNEAELVYLAVLPEHQSKGIGKELVLAMEKELKKRGVKKNVVLARTYLNKFYSELGYEAFGEIIKIPDFAEKGILHQKMAKEL